MSIETWKEEFMPVPASAEMSTLEAIEHSIRKWVGLREENLRRHGLFQDTYLIGEQGPIRHGYIYINNSSCALCVKFLSARYSTRVSPCVRCPLYAALGQVGCSSSYYTRWQLYGVQWSPYDIFLKHGDPEPMITSLLLAKYDITMKQVLG